MWALVARSRPAILSAVVLHWSALERPARSLNQGTFSSMLPIFNTASEIGYGAVIASLAGLCRGAGGARRAPSNVLVNEAIAVNIMAGITGSAAGGWAWRSG